MQSQRQMHTLAATISSSIRLEQESDNDFYQTAHQSQIKPPRLPPQVAYSVCVCLQTCVCTSEMESVWVNLTAAYVGGFVVA